MYNAYNILDPTGLVAYWFDSCRKQTVFWDTLRQRGNNYFKHLEEGQPPVFAEGFGYKMIIDGRKLKDHPVNYALLRIIDNRKNDRRVEKNDTRPMMVDMRESERRSVSDEQSSSSTRPIVVIDPRAGHGPGIGGSKDVSQIGEALNGGGPVYFITFFPNPEPGQTIGDIERAEVIFLEEIGRLHPGQKPFVVGNCQAGWAATLLGADRPELVSGFVLNGAPLSFWSGGEQFMRTRGLPTGVWPVSFYSDLGNGKFDGVHIITGFEDLNPSNTWLTKLYELYSGKNSPKRFLDFEKWWTAPFLMNENEIHFIAEKFFIGNELEQGKFRLDDGRVIDLRNLNNMVIQVFASDGDNITPPSQALGWMKIFANEKEIEDRKLKIFFSLDRRKIGHLAIFVSSIVCGESKEFLLGIEAFENIPPYIYEIIFMDKPEKNSDAVVGEKYGFRIIKSSLDRIREICGPTDTAAFARAAEMSVILDKNYCTYVRPWIKLWVNEWTAEVGRQMHPLRLQHQFLSDRNPLMWPFKFWSPWVAFWPKMDKDNPFLQLEQKIVGGATDALENYRKTRDGMVAQLTKSLLEEDGWAQFIVESQESEVSVN